MATAPTKKAPPVVEDFEGYLNVKRAAFSLDLTSEQIRHACKKGHFPNVKKDGSNRWRIPQDDIEAYRANPPASARSMGGGYMYTIRLTDAEVEKLQPWLEENGVTIERKNKPKTAAEKAEAKAKQKAAAS